MSQCLLFRALGSALTIPLEMLTAANDIASVYKQRDKICALDIVAVEQLECRLTGNFSITCDKLISEVSKTDLIFIPAVWRNPKAALNAHPELVQWLDRQAQAGAILCAATTGAYFCAATGILRRAQATTHWRFSTNLKHSFPMLIYSESALSPTQMVSIAREASMLFATSSSISSMTCMVIKSPMKYRGISCMSLKILCHRVAAAESGRESS